MMIHDIISDMNFKPGDLVVSNKPMQLSGFVWSEKSLLERIVNTCHAISLVQGSIMEEIFYVSIYKKSSTYSKGSFYLMFNDSVSDFKLNEFKDFLLELVQKNKLIFVVPVDNNKQSSYEFYNLMYLIPETLLSFCKKTEKHLLLDFNNE